MECNCNLRTKLVGDGCEVCNPRLAAEIAIEGKLRDFYVYGYTISIETQVALVAKMKAAPFKASSIEAEAIRLGVPNLTEDREPVAMRAADRIIQRERKAGNLELRCPMWVWVGV